VKRSLREILRESNVALVAIAVLLVWSFDLLFWTLWAPLSRTATFLITGVPILGVPYSSPTFSSADRLTLVATFAYLLSAFCSLAAAWLLSRWVYGVGPLSSLTRYRASLARRNHV
jgi:hypothetical protein